MDALTEIRENLELLDAVWFEELYAPDMEPYTRGQLALAILRWLYAGPIIIAGIVWRVLRARWVRWGWLREERREARRAYVRAAERRALREARLASRAGSAAQAPPGRRRRTRP